MILRAILLLACLLKPTAAGAETRYCTDMGFIPHGGIMLGGYRTAIGPDLDRRLAAIARSPETHRICIWATKDTAYQEVAKALAAIQKAGLYINMTGIEGSR